MNKEQKTITVSSYGLFCLSIEVFDEFLKSSKIKSSKLNKYFDKNREVLEQSMFKGAWIPVSIISSVDYIVDIGYESNVFTNDWQQVMSLSGCNLTVGTDGVWIGSHGSIDTWDIGNFKNKNDISYKTMDGETLYNAHKFAIDEGLYKVNIRGFKKKEKDPYPAVNFGFFFELQQVGEFTDFTNPLTRNVNIAKM